MAASKTMSSAKMPAMASTSTARKPAKPRPAVKRRPAAKPKASASRPATKRSTTSRAAKPRVSKPRTAAKPAITMSAAKPAAAKKAPAKSRTTVSKARTAAKHLSSKVLGRLNASGHGHFTVQGRYSAATVRGTVWSVGDRCEGTFTKVTRGVVVVRDFRRRKTITLFTGQSYLARAPGY